MRRIDQNEQKALRDNRLAKIGESGDIENINSVMLDRGVEVVAPKLKPRQQIEKPTRNGWYQYMNDKPAMAMAYDAVNLGLSVAAPFTGGATLIPAAAMTALQGGAAVHDMYNYGLNIENGLDASTMIPGSTLLGKLGKYGLLKAGKSAKYIKRTGIYKGVAPFESGIKMAKRNHKYVPYVAGHVAADGLHWGTEAAQMGKNIDDMINR